MVDLLAFYDELDPELADRVQRRIKAAPDTLATHPFAGPAIASTELQKWPVRGLPLLLLYRVVRPHIEIDRVVHQKQNWSAAN